MRAANRMPVTLCWHCDRMLDAADVIEGDDRPKPEPGSLSLCLYCGAIAVFGDDLRLLAPSEALLDELEGNKEFRAVYISFLWARQRVMLRSKLLGAEQERPGHV